MSPFHLFFYLQITFGLITAVGHTNKKFYKILAEIKALTRIQAVGADTNR